MESEYGKLKLLDRNPRTMSDSSFRRLCESVKRDTDFLMVRGLVVWSDDLIVIGGNQRYRALMEIGLENLETPVERIPASWICLAKHVDGTWWSQAEVDRFILLDNNPDGIAGAFDYEKMVEEFNRDAMAMAGIDFSMLPDQAQAEAFGDGQSGAGSGDGGDGGLEGDGKAKEVEEGQYGENQAALKQFISNRENSRSVCADMAECGYLRVLCFESWKQAQAFDRWLQEQGEKEGGTKVDPPRRNLFYAGTQVAKVAGCELEPSRLHFPEAKVTKALSEMAMENDQEPEDGGLENLKAEDLTYDEFQMKRMLDRMDDQEGNEEAEIGDGVADETDADAEGDLG